MYHPLTWHIWIGDGFTLRDASVEGMGQSYGRLSQNGGNLHDKRSKNRERAD